jgi:SAM-dependent methyltransferase
MSKCDLKSLRKELGGMDIYLLDQILRGRLEPGMKILDAGCGGGRNLFYLAQAGFEVSAVDQSSQAVETVRRRLERLEIEIPSERLRVESLEELSFPDGAFDAVLASAVLHFAPSHAAFRRMVDELWRVTAPGGLLFARLASTIGIEDAVQPLDEPGWYHLPDDSDRFLVDLRQLLALTEELGGELLDPIKTTDVQGLRAMTTWVVRKN